MIKFPDRFNYLKRNAEQMRNQGIGFEQARKLLYTMNIEKCSPPMKNYVVPGIVKEVYGR